MTDALGYVTIHVRIEGIASYKELQCALVVPDLSGLGKRVPVILGTPTIYRLCRQMKESEIHTAPSEWQHAIASYEASLALRAMNVDPNAKYPNKHRPEPLRPRWSGTIERQIQRACIHICYCSWSDQEDVHVRPTAERHDPGPVRWGRGPFTRRTVCQRVYTELKEGSRNVSFVVHNGTSRPVHLSGGRVIARVVAANVVPGAHRLTRTGEQTKPGAQGS